MTFEFNYIILENIEVGFNDNASKMETNQRWRQVNKEALKMIVER